MKTYSTIRNTGFGRLRILDARIDSGSSSVFYVATRPSRLRRPQPRSRSTFGTPRPR